MTFRTESSVLGRIRPNFLEIRSLSTVRSWSIATDPTLLWKRQGTRQG